MKKIQKLKAGLHPNNRIVLFVNEDGTPITRGSGYAQHTHGPTVAEGKSVCIAITDKALDNNEDIEVLAGIEQWGRSRSW